MATPTKLPSGNWNVKVFSHVDENGKRKYISFTAPTKTEVNRMAAEFQANKNIEDRPQDITIKQAMEKYIESRTNIMSPKTLLEYNNWKNSHYKSIENIRIGNLNDNILQKFVNELSKTRQPKTVINYYGFLMSAIKMFTKRRFEVTLPDKVEPERNIPTDEDFKNLLANADPQLKLAMLLAGVGTLRRGEICGIKYGDISRDFNAIYIHADVVLSKDGWVYKPTTKNKFKRRVIMPKEILTMIPEGDPDDFVFDIKPSTITSNFINLRNRLGLKCRFHDLRHYAASLLHAIGVPDVYIMERGGWKSDEVLKSVYRNSLSDKSAHYTSLANDYFSNMLNLSNSLENDNLEAK